MLPAPTRSLRSLVLANFGAGSGGYAAIGIRGELRSKNSVKVTGVTVKVTPSSASMVTAEEKVVTFRQNGSTTIASIACFG